MDVSLDRLTRWAAQEGGPRCLPAECYRDPAIFALERERVLRPGWHAVARCDDLPNAGDYAASSLCGEPIVLVRDERGMLRAFSNVCRHRAHVVATGTGNASLLQCPYHRWSYDLNGSLRNAPLLDGENIDPTRCALRELRSEWWLGFLLVSLDAGVAPIGEALAPLAARLDAHGLSSMRTIGVLDFDSPWNWKVLVDNFMESYHHLGPHAKSFQLTNRAADTFVTDLDVPGSLLENPGVGEAPSFLVGHVFPTLLLAVFEEIGLGSWYEMQIDRHDHFHLRIHALASEELAANAEAVESVLAQTRAIHLEDVAVCEGVQRGLASQLWEPGPLTSYENALARFHRHVADRLLS